jgi:hypothetical protein
VGGEGSNETGSTMSEEQKPPQADPPAVLVHVQVTNTNPWPIEDMFDGTPVVFPPNVPVDVSPDVARHCFGYPGEPRDMAIWMARRYGWATPETMKWTAHKTPQYFEFAQKVLFEPVYYDLVRRKPDDPIPALSADDKDDDPPPIPAESKTTTVVGRNRKYGKAVQDKKKQLEASSKKTSGKQRKPTHINVTEV